MRTLVILLAAALTLASIGRGQAQSPVPPAIAEAIANPARPADEREADADRKPAEIIAFAGLKPGDRVVDLMPGRGYFTRIFAKVVGPSGHVYSVVAKEMTKATTKGVDASAKGFKQLSVLVQPMVSFRVPEPADLVWTSLNYHDLHTRSMGPVDIKAFNKSVFDALKPGGTFLVLDHAAAAGSGMRDTEALHRIDPATVKTEVEAAGFVLEASSDLLANPADPHTQHVADSSVRGKTDKFIFRFRKPTR